MGWDGVVESLGARGGSFRALGGGAVGLDGQDIANNSTRARRHSSKIGRHFTCTYYRCTLTQLGDCHKQEATGTATDQTDRKDNTDFQLCGQELPLRMQGKGSLPSTQPPTTL